MFCSVCGGLLVMESKQELNGGKIIQPLGLGRDIPEFTVCDGCFDAVNKYMHVVALENFKYFME